MSEEEKQDSESFKNLTIKGINESIYLQVKAEAIRRSITIGEVINEALALWLRSNQLDAMKKWKYEILDKMKNLAAEQARSPGSPEVYQDLREEFKRDLEKINEKIASLANLD